MLSIRLFNVLGYILNILWISYKINNPQVHNHQLLLLISNQHLITYKNSLNNLMKFRDVGLAKEMSLQRSR